MLPRSLALDRATVAFVAACSLLVALAFLLRIPSLVEPRWYRDEGIFAAVANDVRHGQTLYSGAWDNKPPLIFYTYAAIQALLGTGMFPLHLVTTFVVVLTLVVTMVVATRLYGRGPALVAGATFVLLMCTPVIEGNLALTEAYMILPTTLAMLAVLRARDMGSDRGRLMWYAGAGALISIAASYKQVAVFDGLAIVVFVWLTEQHRVRTIGAFAAAFAIPQIAFAAYFVVAGAFPQYWYAAVGSLPLYASLGPDESPLLRFAGFLPALLVTAWLVRLRGEGGAVTDRHLAPLWLGFAIAGVTSSNLPFPHYLQQAVPAFALTVGSIPLFMPRDGLERGALATAGVLAAALVVGQFGEARDRRQLSPLAYYHNYLSRETGNRDYQQYERFFDGSGEATRDISDEIHRDGAGTTVYTWSELPWLYAAGDVTNPVRYYTSFLGEMVPGAKPTIMRQLAASPPAYIVVSDDAYAPFLELNALIASRYVPVASANDWHLYRLATLQGALPPLTPQSSPGG